MMQFENINDVQLTVLNRLLRDGERVDTRGFRTLELSPVSFTVTNPRNRITSVRGRKWNFSAAVGELLWHLSASDEVSFITEYLKQWAKYSDDGRHIRGSCYGHKIFRKEEGGSRWEKLIGLLSQDPGSRRAVIDLADGDGLSLDTADVSCTCTLQFMIRHGRLNLVVYMRSNDIIWGLPYDFFFFSFLQELLAVTLDVPLGTYTHFAASLHLYDYHFGLAEKMLRSEYGHCSMPPMPDAAGIAGLVDAESKIRKGTMSAEEITETGLDPYWVSLLMVLFYHRELKNGGSKVMLDELKTHTTYAELL